MMLSAKVSATASHSFFDVLRQHLLLQLEWIDEHPIEAMQTVAGHLGIFPFSESELRDLVRVGTDRLVGAYARK